MYCTNKPTSTRTSSPNPKSQIPKSPALNNHQEGLFVRISPPAPPPPKKSPPKSASPRKSKKKIQNPQTNEGTIPYVQLEPTPVPPVPPVRVPHRIKPPREKSKPSSGTPPAQHAHARPVARRMMNGVLLTLPTGGPVLGKARQGKVQLSDGRRKILPPASLYICSRGALLGHSSRVTCGVASHRIALGGDSRLRGCATARLAVGGRWAVDGRISRGGRRRRGVWRAGGLEVGSRSVCGLYGCIYMVKLGQSGKERVADRRRRRQIDG